jgi:hypothetical protein
MESKVHTLDFSVDCSHGKPWGACDVMLGDQMSTRIVLLLRLSATSTKNPLFIAYNTEKIYVFGHVCTVFPPMYILVL